VNCKKLRVFEGFAGYGGGSFALNRLKEKYPNFDYEVVGYSEVDKYACELYDLNHKDEAGNNIKNYGDITKINPEELPEWFKENPVVMVDRDLVFKLENKNPRLKAINLK